MTPTEALQAYGEALRKQIAEQIADEARQARERDEQIIAMLADIRALLSAPVPTPSPAPVVTPPALTVPDLVSSDSVPIVDGMWAVMASPWGMGGQPRESFAWAGMIADGKRVTGRAAWSVVPLAGTDVKAFPRVWTGRTPGHPTHGDVLPVRVSDARGVYRSRILQDQVTGRGHLAYNLWVVSSPEDRRGWTNALPLISGEILVQRRRWGDYCNPHGRYPGARNHQRLVAQGVTFAGAVCSIFAGTSGAKDVPLWTITPHDGQAIPYLDLAELVTVLRGELPSEHYLADVELGVELVDGTGDVVYEMEAP